MGDGSFSSIRKNKAIKLEFEQYIDITYRCCGLIMGMNFTTI